jgi:hypothetical protein
MKGIMSLRSLALVASIILALASCAKESEPVQRTFDFTGRRYERYKQSSFDPSKRYYYAIDFTTPTNMLTYNGSDRLGLDSVWHRSDTIYQRCWAYSIRESLDKNNLLLSAYVSEEPFDTATYWSSGLNAKDYVIDTTETTISNYAGTEIYIRVQ